jgi:sec-independent protein translocase protein TatA
MPGGPEWFIVLIVVLVFFGNRIPGVARSLGSGITEFRKGLKDGEADEDTKKVGNGESS